MLTPRTAVVQKLNTTNHFGCNKKLIICIGSTAAFLLVAIMLMLYFFDLFLEIESDFFLGHCGEHLAEAFQESVMGMVKLPFRLSGRDMQSHSVPAQVFAGVFSILFSILFLPLGGFYLLYLQTKHFTKYIMACPGHAVFGLLSLGVLLLVVFLIIFYVACYCTAPKQTRGTRRNRRKFGQNANPGANVDNLTNRRRISTNA